MKNKDYFQQENSNNSKRNYELFESNREPLLANIKKALYELNKEEEKPRYYTRKKQPEEENSLSEMRPTRIIYNSLLANHPIFDKNSNLNYSRNNSSQNYSGNSNSQGYLERSVTKPSYSSSSYSRSLVQGKGSSGYSGRSAGSSTYTGKGSKAA